ncbi:MAG: cytochrome c1 [Granulosicoccaceae bacterium]
MLGRKFIVAAVACLLPVFAQAAGGGGYLETVHLQPSNKASLQRGARTYVNYCLGCHSLGYLRYNRMAEDLGLPADIVEENLIFTSNADGERHKVTDMMNSAMSTEYAKGAFGVAPPDLSLTARSRGVDWLYTYLKTFYVDESKTVTGHNNLAFPDVGMPNVLWELQGLQRAVYIEEDDGHGGTHKVFEGFEQITEGQLSAAEYDKVIRDLVNFLFYAAEPGRAQRLSMGIWVMLFLFVFTAGAYVLKKEWWRDVR